MSNNITYNNKMQKAIILSSCLFGSAYLMSKSLKIINRSFLVKKIIPKELIIVNGLLFTVSSSIFIFINGFTILRLLNI
jgi:hypothetical protein